jgi:hypothetical protein
MRALGDLVQTGKVRYLGFSDAPAKMSLSRGGTIGTDGLQECPINAYQSGQNWNAESTVILHINVCTIVGHCTKLWPLWHVRGNRKYFGQLACEIAMVSAEYLAATTALIWVRIPLYRAYKQPSLLGHWFWDQRVGVRSDPRGFGQHYKSFPILSHGTGIEPTRSEGEKKQKEVLFCQHSAKPPLDHCY